MKKKRTIFPCWWGGKKSYTMGGQIQCDVCKSFSGVKARHYHNYKRDLHKLFMKCIHCGSKEVINQRTGEILEQIKEKI